MMCLIQRSCACCLERCCSLWLCNDCWVDCLSRNCVTVGSWVTTFWPIYCWSSSGNGVDWLWVSVISTMAGNDWCISILTLAFVDWRILMFVIQTRDCFVFKFNDFVFSFYYKFFNWENRRNSYLYQFFKECSFLCNSSRVMFSSVYLFITGKI